MQRFSIVIKNIGVNIRYNAGGVRFSHIPSKGDQESTASLLGGHIDAISTTSGWIPQVDAGNLRLLATYGEKRAKKFPNVPTVVELGYKVIHNSPIGIVGPKDLPKDIVKILHDAFKKSLDDPNFLSVMDNYQMPVMYQIRTLSIDLGHTGDYFERRGI